MEAEDDGKVVPINPDAIRTSTERRRPDFAIDLGLRQRVEGLDCEGEMIAYFCSRESNGSMAFVHSDDVTVAGGKRRVTCRNCDVPHQLISIEEAMNRHFVIGVNSSKGCEDVILSTDHEVLLCNRLELMQRSMATRAALARQASRQRAAEPI